MPPARTDNQVDKTNQEKLKSASVIAVSLLNDSRAEIATDSGEKFVARIADLKAVEENKETILVFHDAVFGLAKLQQRNCEPKGVIFDVKLSDSLLTAGLKLSDSYGAITERYLGEEKRKIDPVDLLRLRETLRQQLKQENLVQVAQIEFEATKATASMQNNGLGLDIDLLKQKQQRLEAVKTRTASEIKAWLGQKLPDEKVACASVDWASNGRKHKSEILRLLKKAGIPLENSLSKDVLKGLSQEHPILEKLIEHRSSHHRMGKGGIGGLLDKADSQGKVYPTWNQNVASTGRMSATNPAVQNIPHDLAEAVIPSKEGYVFVRADYSQIELRVLAEIAGDKKLIEAFRQGKDPHRLTASLMTGKPEAEIRDAERKAAKPVNFGKVYGQSAQGLVQYAKSTYGVTFTLEEAKKYQQAITKGYPQIGERETRVKAEFTQQWQQSLKRDSKQPLWQGTESPQTLTIAGRRRLWKAVYGKEPPVTEALNAAIQGTSADITKYALASLPEVLEGTKASLVAARHDEIVLEVPLEEAKLVSEMLNQTMVKAGERFLKEVPVVCDVEICQNMAGLGLTPEQQQIVSGENRDLQQAVPEMNTTATPIKKEKDFDIRAYVEVTEGTGGFDRAPCPSCIQEGKEADNQNLSINKETGYFKCWRDSKNHNYGNIREALGLPRSGPIPEHLKKTAPEITVNSKPSPPVVKTVSRSQVEQSQQRLQKHPTALAYLESRGITPEMAQRYNLGLDSAYKGKNGIERPEAIAIFYQDATDPQTYYRKKRYAPWSAKEDLPKGTPKWGQYGVPASVWVAHNPPGAKQTYLTEGAWDAIRLSEELRKSGEKIAVASCTTGATGIPPYEQLAAIPTDKVTIFYDLDKAGSEGASSMADALSEVGKQGEIATVPYQGKVKGGYDLSDAMDAGYSLSDIHRAANNANQLVVGEKVKVAYIPPSVKNLETGVEVTVTTTPSLRGNQEVVGIETGEGKTFLLPRENLEKPALTSEQIENKAKELAALNYVFEQIPWGEKEDKNLAKSLSRLYEEKLPFFENQEMKVVTRSQEMLSELKTDKLNIKTLSRALERLKTDLKIQENLQNLDKSKMTNKTDKTERNESFTSSQSSQKKNQRKPNKKMTSLISVKRIKGEINQSFDAKQVEEKAKATLEYGGLINPLVVHREDHQNYTIDPISAFDLAVAQKARELEPLAGEMVNGWVIENELEEKALLAQLDFEAPTINSEEIQSIRLNHDSQTSEKLEISKHKKTQALVSVKRIKSEVNQQFEAEKIEKQARNLLEYGALVKPLVVRREDAMNFVVHPDSAFDLGVAQRAREIDPVAGEMVNAWILETPIEEKAYAVQRSVSPSSTKDLETEKWVEWDELIKKIDVEMERIGWSSKQGRDYLQQNYGVKSRQQLTDEQLFSFLEHIESQPTEVVVQSRPTATELQQSLPPPSLSSSTGEEKVKPVTQEKLSRKDSLSSNKPKPITKPVSNKPKSLSTNQQQTTSTMISSEQVHETKKGAEELQAVPHEIATEGAKILKKILDRIKNSQKNKEKKGKLNIDLDSGKNPVEVQFNLDKEQVFKGEPNDKSLDKLKGISQKDLAYLEKALDLAVGKAPEEFNRNLTIKFNEKEVFRLENGVVKVTELSPEKKQSKSLNKTQPKVQEKPKDKPITASINSSVVGSREETDNQPHKNDSDKILSPEEFNQQWEELEKELKEFGLKYFNTQSKKMENSTVINVSEQEATNHQQSSNNSAETQENSPVTIPIQRESDKQSRDFIDKLRTWNQAYPIENESKTKVKKEVENGGREQDSVSIPIQRESKTSSIEQNSEKTQENNKSLKGDKSLEKSLSQLGLDHKIVSQVIAQVKSRENKSSPVIVVVNNQPEPIKEKKEKVPNLFEKAKQGLKKSLTNLSQSIKKQLSQFKQQGEKTVKNTKQRLKSLRAGTSQKQEVQRDFNNVTALGATSRIMANFGQDNGQGGQVFEGNTFRFEKTNNDLKIIAKDGRGEILNFEKGNLSGNLNKADLKQLKRIDKELDKTTTMMRSSERSYPKKEMAMEM